MYHKQAILICLAVGIVVFFFHSTSKPATKSGIKPTIFAIQFYLLFIFFLSAFHIFLFFLLFSNAFVRFRLKLIIINNKRTIEVMYTARLSYYIQNVHMKKMPVRDLYS